MADNLFVYNIVNEYGFFIVLIGGMLFGMIFMYKKIRKVPINPDYIKVFHEGMIGDEKLNHRERRFGVKLLYRGHELIGKVLTHSLVDYKVPKKSSLRNIGKTNYKGEPWKLDEEKMSIHTVTFKKPLFNFIFFRIFSPKKEILKFSDNDNFKIEEKGKLVFSSDTAFNALGNVFATVTSYEQIASTILDHYHKNMLLASNNMYAAEASKIGSIPVQYAHELSLKRLEIEKIRAEKAAKLGQIV